ncbi:hypothetical protein ACFLYD_02930 [Chloroflexota bacterium]
MLGKILVVENTSPYAEEVCEKLRVLGCEALWAPSQETLDWARSNPDNYNEIVLGSVWLALEEGEYDIVIVNMHLEDESDSYPGFGDFLGDEVLTHVTANYPGISCIVCTVHTPTSYDHMRTRYNLADLIDKEGIPLPTDALCDAVKRVLVDGHPVRRLIDTRAYEVNGVNSRIYRFLHNRGIMPRIFSGIADYDDRLIKILGGNLQDERVGEATRLMADLWHLEAGLPCYPLIYNLGELEFNRAFWEGHRDHLIHQLLVYLLGLYLYYGSEPLRSALSTTMSETGFLLVWKITALFHDLGYVFEVERKKHGKINKDAIEDLNDLREYCLHHYFAARGIDVLRAENKNLREEGEIFFQKVAKKQILSLARFGKEDLFLILEPQARTARLGKAADSLKRYWEYAMSDPSEEGTREAYIDHGIAGALVLLQQYRSLQDLVQKSLPIVEPSSPELPVTSETAELVRELASQIEDCRVSLELAASAIALHNVNVDNWDHNDAFTREQLTLHQYSLSLEQTPLAFFLALVDALQSWDRPKFTMPKGSTYVMQAQDIVIGLNQGKIAIAYVADPLHGKPGSVFSQIVELMSHYMQPDDLSAILEAVSF